MAMATAAQGVIGLVGGAAKFSEGRKMQNAAQASIDNFEWKDPQNAFRNQQVSTLGSELQREENARATATSTEALRSGGTRAIVGGLGRVVAQSNQVNREVGANLDQQQKQIDMAAAQDDVRIRDIHEKRQTEELEGYGAQLNAGMGMKWKGVGDGINAVGALGQGLIGMKENGAFGANKTNKDGTVDDGSSGNPKGYRGATGLASWPYGE